MYMNHPVMTEKVVSNRNQRIAMWLIEQFEIRQGYGLAYYLKMPICNDNYSAVCLWVQYHSLLQPKQFYTLGELRQGFAKLLPIEKYWR